MRRVLLGATLVVCTLARAQSPLSPPPLPSPTGPARATQDTDGEDAPVFDASTPAPVDGRLRWELRAGLALPEQASRLRVTSQLLGASASRRPLPRLRVDGGYLFTWANQGTATVSMLNTHHTLQARAHWLVPAGPTWFTFGGGPALHLTTAHPSVNGDAQRMSALVNAGLNVAGGVETEVAGRLFRIEAAAQSRGLRVDLMFLAGVGF